MLVPVLLFIVGLLFLIKGGDWFVDGASALARRFHLPELLIGATVVSIGTTLPEVMVSTMAAAIKKKITGVFSVLGSTLPGRTAIVMAAISAELQMTEPMALP